MQAQTARQSDAVKQSGAWHRPFSLLAAMAIASAPTTALAQEAATAQAPVVGQAESTSPTPLLAQATPAPTVLQGRVSNVDSLSREILRDELKLEKYNLNYRLNAAKQGRWKGWRYFFFQEAGLALNEVGYVKNVEYRGKHLHHPTRNRKPIIANYTILPVCLGFWVGAGGDAIELSVNSWHSYEAWRKGYSQTQARKYVSSLIADIDKKMAEREAAIKQEPSSDAELARLQEMEGRLLSDFRDLSLAEFERFHTGTSRTLTRENSFYALDFAKNVVGIYNGMEAMNLVMRGHNRSLGVFAVTSTIISSMIMADPILARVLGSGAAYLDRRNMAHHGLASVDESAARLKADYASMAAFAAEHKASEKADVATALDRLDAYDTNQTYYATEIQKNAATIRRGNRAAIQNMGMGLMVGGSRLVQGVVGDYVVQYHQHVRGPADFINVGTHKVVQFPQQFFYSPPKGFLAARYGSPKPTKFSGGAGVWVGRETNEWLYAASVAYVPAISIAILDSCRIRLAGELAYQRQKRNHTLPGQVVRSRLAQLDRIESKL